MTTPAPRNAQTNRRSRRLLGVLLSLSVVGAACGSSEPTLNASTRPIDRSTEPSTESPIDETLSIDSGGPQFGDSLDEFFDSSGGPDAALSFAAGKEGFQEISWDDLIPPGYSGEEISARFADQLEAVEPGSHEASAIYEEMQEEFDADVVNTAFDGSSILLAGFVAPLTYEGELVTEFLLVPYFGACIHVPAPPPNQTVMVTLADGGLTFEEAWGPIWVTGDLTVTSTEHEIGNSGYSIEGAQYGVHEDGY